MPRVLHYLLHHSFASVAGSLLYAAVASAAVLRGDPPARLLGAALLLDYLLVFAVDNYVNVGAIAPGVFLLDVILFCVAAGLAVRYFTAWLVVAAGAQLMAVCTHLAKLFDPSIGGRVYITCEIVCGYGVIAALAAGLAQQWLRDRSHASRRG